jgi:tRNA/rRNA methyltransferase
MKNMGLRHLVLVNPQCDLLGDEARKMAVHATDILETADVVATLPEALSGCQRAIATTARERALPTALESPRTALPWLLADAVPSAVIFGSEERGLSNMELNYAQRFVKIPVNPEYPSLNLAQSVAICCYELYQTASASLSEAKPVPTPSPPLPLSPSPSPSSLDAMEGYYQQMEEVLLKIGYLHPHTAAKRMEKLRRLFNRANLSESEVAMLRGIFRQMSWGREHLPPPSPPPLGQNDSL